MSENANAPKMRLWSMYFVLIIIMNCLVSACMYFHNAITTLYVTSLGGTASYAGVMLTCFTISATIMRIISGRLLDKKGRRIIIMIGLAIYAAASASMTLGILPYLLVARILQAIGYSMATTGISVAVTDVLPVPRMGEGIGYSGLATTLASALGPVVALSIYSASQSYEVVYFASAAMVIAALVIMVFCRYEKDTVFFARKHEYEMYYASQKAALQNRPAPQPQKEAPKKTGFVGFITGFFEVKALPSTVISLFNAIATGATVAFLTLYATKINIANPKPFYYLQAVTTVVARLTCGKLSDKYNPLVSLLPGIGLLAVGYYMLMEAAAVPAFFYIAGALIGAGTGIATPALNAEAVRHVPQSRRGVASGTFFIAMDVGIGIGGVLWGSIVDNFDIKYIFGGSVICVAIAAVLSIILFSKKKQKA